MEGFRFDPAAVGLRVTRPKGYAVVQIEPAGFYELTADDLRRLEADRTARPPSRQSDEDRLARLAAAPKTALKFRYADGTEVVRTFAPRETVADVYAFVREVTVGAFALARTAGAPRWVPESPAPLYAAGLVPSGVLCVVGVAGGGRPAPSPALFRDPIKA